MADRRHLNLDQIAAEIHVRLKTLEHDEGWNLAERGGMCAPRIYQPNVWASGNRVMVSYVNYQSGETSLSRAEALVYLEWLDAGNKGTHMAMAAAGRIAS